MSNKERHAERDEHDWGDQYEHAMKLLEKHITRAEDGTFHSDIKRAKDIGVDPVAFADLKRSLEETNRKILNNEITVWEITNH